VSLELVVVVVVCVCVCVWVCLCVTQCCGPTKSQFRVSVSV